MSPPANEIVLASASPRRRELLTQVGLQFAVVPADADETLLATETPREHVERLSRAKAHQVGARADQPGRWFIGSDTVVVCDGVVLGKPADAAQAARMLRHLSGRSHEVISGYAIYDRQAGTTICDSVVTKVFFKALTATEIEGYIATGEPFDKAGAYAIQGIGAFMVPRIEGSYSNVVGLPLCAILSALEEIGAIRSFPAPQTR